MEWKRDAFVYTFLGGIVISYVIGGWLLTLIFFLLWFDKIILSGARLWSIGIELTTFLAVIIGIKFGFFAFLYVFLISILLDALKFYLFGGDIMPFVPMAPHFVDALSTLAAHFMKGFDFFIIFTAVFLLKILMNFLTDLALEALPLTPKKLMNVIFNILLALYLASNPGILAVFLE
ncbi:MAG: hypothetical protein HYW26_06105 [Candidatus Aenigmarchaeota archaeon]|nr:hypothetical protein [Candidatus Aenigmarchaeota archaeon]